MENSNSSRSEEDMLLKLEKGPLSNVDVDEGSTTINLVLIYSIFTAVCGSFVIGFATGYTSPVQSGIIADMGLTIADVCVGLMALSGSSGAGGIIGYATATFESAGFSGTVGTVAMALTQLPPTILGVFLMDKFGRRPLLLISAATFPVGLGAIPGLIMSEVCMNII
ncbi:hypothetical protein SOVF_067420 [Spinacia oleracea]|nr:hypothetical protein SOVF_067420 [Spinacia oleracea]